MENTINKDQLIEDEYDYVEGTDVNDPIEVNLKEVLSNVVKRDTIMQHDDLMKATSQSAVVQVCCAQSGYTANMTPLKYREFFKMSNSETSSYENRKMTYKTIYDKISSTSITDWQMTFEEWLKATSVYDMETLCYGIFCATYQNDGRYTYTCPRCKNQVEVILDHNSIIHRADTTDMSKLSDKIVKESDTIDKLQQYSLVLKEPTTIQLSNSKIVFELRIPSLYDMLALLKAFSDEELEAIESSNEKFSLTIMLTTKNVYIPINDKNQLDKYSKYSTKKDIQTVLDNLPPLDFAQLKRYIIRMLNKYHVSYSIDNVKCTHPSCDHVVDTIPLNLEDILFAHIASLIW